MVRSVTRDRPVPQDQPGPVLLVPGYGGRTASLDPLAAALRQRGSYGRRGRPARERHRGPGRPGRPPRRRGRPGAAAPAGHRRSTSSGYSAGGVVVRLWVRDHGGAGQARRVLTLGSPQHGTSVAALGAEVAGGCPTACEQLLPDSTLLRRLNAGDETPAGPVVGDGAFRRRRGGDPDELGRARRRPEPARAGPLPRGHDPARRPARRPCRASRRCAPPSASRPPSAPAPTCGVKFLGASPERRQDAPAAREAERPTTSRGGRKTSDQSEIRVGAKRRQRLSASTSEVEKFAQAARLKTTR